MKCFIYTFLLAVFVVSCATKKPAPAIPVPVFSQKPSVVKVTDHVTAAKKSVSEARVNVNSAQTRTSEVKKEVNKATDSAKVLSESTVPIDPKELNKIVVDLEFTKKLLDSLGIELDTTIERLTMTEDELIESEKKAEILNKEVTELTEKFNVQSVELANSRSTVEMQKQQVADFQEQVNKTKRELFYQKVKTWAFTGGLILLAILAVVFKVVGFGARVSSFL